MTAAVATHTDTTTEFHQQQDEEPEFVCHQGIAMDPEVPDRDRKRFRGRKGFWACEKCMHVTHLETRTKQWTCSRCHAIMYTLPTHECPLQKLRRHVLRQRKP